MIITCCLWHIREEQQIASHPTHTFDVVLHPDEYRSLQARKVEQKQQTILIKIGVILAWIIFFIVVYHISPSANKNEVFNPFVVLHVDEEASVSEIKQAYHELSKQHHPDRGGDPEKFKELVKAYNILTNEKAKENWSKYGNPDGPKELYFGFALPNWLFDSKNSMFILCTYTSFFLFVPLICCCCS